MKKLSIFIVTGTLVLMLLLPSSSLAQEIRGGLKLGLNMANIHGTDVANFENETGESWGSKIAFCFGGYVTFKIGEMFAIQPEAFYTMKGAKLETTLLGETVKLKLNFSYLEIPVLAKLLIPTQSSVKPSLFAGPVLALKLSGKAWAEYAGVSDEEDIEDMKGTDFGLIIGGGIDFGLGAASKGKITVDLRYVLGLTTIYKPLVEGEEILDIKNGVFSLMIGYSF
jgi:hypothetical protein